MLVYRRALRHVSLGFLLACGGLWGADTPASVCEIVQLKNADPRVLSGLNAETVAANLSSLPASMTVKVLGPDRLLACADKGNLPVLKQAIAAVSSENARPESPEMRLFSLRDAPAIASALDAAIAGIGVKSIGDDRLVFKLSGPRDETPLREVKRIVTLLDAPKPEVTLNAWSVQVSSSDSREVDNAAREIRGVVYQYDKELQLAISRAWTYLYPIRRNPENWAKPLTPYVLEQFVSGPNGNHCTGSFYCLGYQDAFSSTMQPSLANIIGILAGLSSPNVDGFVNELEGKAAGAEYQTGADCQGEDDQSYADATERRPHFACFREQLKTSFYDPIQLARLRTSMVDFLFQYKFSVAYPHDFDSYDYASSAQRLDVAMNPILVAFNQDLVIYLRQIQKSLKDVVPQRSDSNSSDSIVTVRTISGTDASASTQSQSAFKMTPPPLVQDVLKQLINPPAAMPGVVSKYLPPNAAQALVAFLASGASSTVAVGRDLNLTLTPNTLPGASTAELKITLDAKDEGAPQVIGPDGKSANDTSDRAAEHSITTNVRVDSLNLFEISTFAARISRGREPIPVLPPLVQLPYIGSLIKLPRKPGQAYHQSFAIGSATILPTAADLLNGLRFSGDKWMWADEEEVELYKLPQARRQELAEQIQRFHRVMLECIASSALSPSGPATEECQEKNLVAFGTRKKPAGEQAAALTTTPGR